jgi:hypothetical protein
MLPERRAFEQRGLTTTVVGGRRVVVNNGLMQGDRDPRWWLRPALIGGGVVALLIGVVAAMPKVFPFQRGSGSTDAALPDNPIITDYLLVAVVVLLIVTAVMIRLLVQRGASAEPPKRRPLWAQILSFMLILFFVATVSSLLEERGVLEPPDAAPTGEVEGAGASEPQRSRPLGLLLTGVLVLVVAGLVAMIVMLGRKDKRRGDPRSVDEVLAEEIDLGLAELEGTDEPRDAVIACYVRMERALVTAGVPRKRSETPFEFIEKALEQAAVPPDSARRLTTLFERARFSPHPTSPEMTEEAVATLQEVRALIGGVRWPA